MELSQDILLSLESFDSSLGQIQDRKKGGGYLVISSYFLVKCKEIFLSPRFHGKFQRFFQNNRGGGEAGSAPLDPRLAPKNCAIGKLRRLGDLEKSISTIFSCKT